MQQNADYYVEVTIDFSTVFKFTLFSGVSRSLLRYATSKTYNF